MEWITTAQRLLAYNKPDEALALINKEVTGKDEMLISQFSQLLMASKDNIEKGTNLMAAAMKDKEQVKYSMKRYLNTLVDETASMDRCTILFLGAKPNGLPTIKIEKEYGAIMETLQEAEFNFNLPLNSSLRPNKFGALLKKHAPTYLHFAGHGMEEVAGFHCQGIVFEAANKDPIVPPNSAVVKTLKTVLKSVSMKGVIINACHSFQLAKEISTLGIYAIGMTDEISDNGAIAFSEGFYGNFGGIDQNFVRAFEYGVNNISMQGDEYLPFVDIPAIYRDGEKLKIS